MSADGGGRAGGATVGATGAIRAAWSLPHRLSFFVGVDADVVQRQVVGRIDGMPFAASPRYTLSAIAGVGMELGE